MFRSWIRACAHPPDGGGDPGDADLHDALVVVVVEVILRRGDLFDLLQHLRQVSGDVGVGQREQVPGLGQVPPGEHLVEQVVHPGAAALGPSRYSLYWVHPASGRKSACVCVHMCALCSANQKCVQSVWIQTCKGQMSRTADARPARYLCVETSVCTQGTNMKQRRLSKSEAKLFVCNTVGSAKVCLRQI